MNPAYQKFIGILWILVACLLAIFADATYKSIQQTSAMPVGEILCFKHFFSFVGTIFLLLVTKRSLKYKPEYKLESIRGSLIVLSTLLWYYGLCIASLSASSLIALVQPVFIMLFAGLILKEKIILSKLFIMFVMLAGIFFINIHVGKSLFAGGTIFLLIAVSLFSVLDVLTKKLSLSYQDAITNTFYSNMFSAVFSLPVLAFINFIKPDLYQLSLLILLGLLHNFMTLAFILAFEKADLNILAPYKYSEILFAVIVDYVLFSNIPDQLTRYQAICILACSIIISIIDRIRLKKLARISKCLY